MCVHTNKCARHAATRNPSKWVSVPVSGNIMTAECFRGFHVALCQQQDEHDCGCACAYAVAAARLLKLQCRAFPIPRLYLCLRRSPAGSWIAVCVSILSSARVLLTVPGPLRWSVGTAVWTPLVEGSYCTLLAAV